MLRALLRRLPRFGFVTLFAAMLLFVSAAGWLKFHLDLWQEEQALLADLGKAGVDYAYSRHSGDVDASPNTAVGRPIRPPRFWDPLVPYFSRIDNINFRDPAPRDLLERAARLPYVRSVSGGGVAPPGTPTAEALAAEAGFECETLPAPAVPGELPPLAKGEPVDGAEPDACRNAFVASLNAETPAPIRGTAYSVLASPTARRFYARDADVRFGTFDGAFAITTAKSHDTYLVDADGSWQNSRLDDTELATEMLHRENPPLLLFEPMGYFEPNVQALGINAAFESALEKPESIAVSQVDDVRVRFDFPTLEVDYPAADCRDSFSVALVVRRDLDWEVEAWDIVGARTAGPSAPVNLPSLGSASFRGTLRREEDWIVAESWVADFLSFGVATPAGHPPVLGPMRYAGVARYDFSPDLDLSHVTPELFDARRLPPQRELHWLPWHGVTFALSLALFAYVGVRRIVGGRTLPREPS